MGVYQLSVANEKYFGIMPNQAVKLERKVGNLWKF
jgi:hypothetical protein